jgi:SAM-dependent methyltransferase
MIPIGRMLATQDQYLAPSVLVPFAEDMAHRLSRISTGPLLETCAGAGALTQAIASSVSAGMTMIATDPSADAIAYAQARPGVARVSWQQADPVALPFPDASFGIVTCQFGIVATPDPVRVFVEARRVMRPGARFVFNVPSLLRQNPVADCLQDAMDMLFPADPPKFREKVLHGHADNAAIDDDLTEAGFTEAFYTSVELPYLATAAWDAAAGYCLGTALRAEIEDRAPGEAERVTRDAAAVLERRFGTGPIATTMRASVISAAG